MILLFTLSSGKLLDAFTTLLRSSLHFYHGTLALPTSLYSSEILTQTCEILDGVSGSHGWESEIQSVLPYLTSIHSEPRRIKRLTSQSADLFRQAPFIVSTKRQ